MDEIIGFKDLKIGQFVKVKGKPGEGGTFTALEITVKPPKNHSEIVGLLQSLDPPNALRILNLQLAVPNAITVTDLDENTIGLHDLKPNGMVKIKGKYSAAEGFLPAKIQMYETKAFNIERLQGTIEKIDVENKTLQVVGFKVMVSRKTTIEGF
jgi:hypothetical protein